MTFFVEDEVNKEGTPELESLLEKVGCGVMESEGCPYEVQVNLLITDDEGIREINKGQRGIDSATDVLSFPVHEFETPACFQELEGEEAMDCFDPDTGELMLGDIVISIDRAFSQAESYGHTIYREIAFLIAHSMLHLIGYDHMEKDEEELMFSKQKSILEGLGITRGQDS